MGQDKPTQLGPLERASLNHWTFHIQDMDRVQNKPNSSVQHTPSSESFQVYQCQTVERLGARRNLVPDPPSCVLVWG
jgi:hypothetical protein